jgi:hypothetical protein
MGCRQDICRGDNRKGDCKCYGFGNADNQMCAREKDGVYYECEAGCCNDGLGCPGQCEEVAAAPAFRVVTDYDTINTKKSMTFEKAVNALVLTLMAIALMRLVVSISALFPATCKAKPTRG